MTEKKYTSLFLKAIKKADKALDGNIDVKSIEIDDEEKSVWCKLSYCIDDRKRDSDEEAEKSIMKALGEGYHAGLDRMDAYPDGTAHYHLIISKNC